MADTYDNPYASTSPLGAALKNLSGALAKPSNEAAQINHLEHALALKQKRENTAGLGEALRQLGTANFDRKAAIDMAVRGGVDPNTLGGYERYNSANEFGATDQRTTNAFVGAGGAYGSTAAGFRENEAGQQRRADNSLAEQRRQFDMAPTTVSGDTGPTIVPRSQAYGQPAVEDLGKVKGDAARRAINAPGGLAAADDATSRFIGVDGKNQATPRNYVAGGKNYITNDGLTDAASGQPLPSGGYLANAQGPAESVGLGKSVVTDLQKSDISNQRFRSLLNYTKDIAAKDPTNFGVTGMVKGVVQDANAAAGNIANGLGYPGLQEGLNEVRQKAMANGISPSVLSGVFDPNLPKLHTAAGLVLFSAAEALAGQSGRAVSNDDVKRIQKIVGDPAEWSQSQEKFNAKLETLGEILELNNGVIANNLRRSQPAAPQIIQPDVPTATGADGTKLFLRNGQWSTQ